MIGRILWIPCYKNRLCVCPSLHPFYFKSLFLSNRQPDLDLIWHEGGYWQWIYKSWKSGWSVIRSGFHIIERAVHMCLFSFLSPIFQQPQGRFRSIMPGKWVLSVSLWIPKITMITHILWILCYKNRLCVCPCICPFYFECLFLSNCPADFN